MVYLLNFHELLLGLSRQLRSPIWCQFISALRAVKEAKPCCSDKILLRWILQYWAGPDYHTENIEPVITAECSWNGEVHSLIILRWPLAYLKHTHKAVHESRKQTHRLARKHRRMTDMDIHMNGYKKGNIQLHRWKRKGEKTILGEKWLVDERAVYFLQTDQQTLHCILTNKQPGD